MKIYTYVKIDMNTLDVVEEESYEYTGEVALCKGPSGSVSYPDYMQEIQVQWLTGGTQIVPRPSLFPNVEDVMRESLGLGGNPYDTEIAYDPLAAPGGGGGPPGAPSTDGSPISDMQARHHELDIAINALNPVTDYSAFVTQAISDIDGGFVTEAEINTEVDAFEVQVRARRLNELSTWTAGMADINAVVGSQFVIGMAMREADIANEITKFESNLRIQLKVQRTQLIDSAVRVMTQMLQGEIQAHMGATQLQAEISRLKIVSLKEQTDRDLEIDVLDASWELSVFQYGSNLLGVLGGNTMPNVSQPSTAQSAIGGAISGAAAGAAITGGNPVGVGIGALAGGIGGLLG